MPKKVYDVAVRFCWSFQLGTNPQPRDIINPMFLNNCLTKAVRLSVNADDKYADNVSFKYKYMPRVIDQSSPDVFDCIQLDYKVGAHA